MTTPVDYELLASQLAHGDIVALDLPLFSHDGSLAVAVGATLHHVTFRGVHLCLTRQALWGVDARPNVGSVDFLRITQESPLLQKFLREDLALDTSVVLYDSAMRRPSDPSFEWPVHVTLVCDLGTIDIVCEAVEVDFKLREA